MPILDMRDKLIVGLDLPTVAEAEAMVRTLGDDVVFYKVGLQLTFAGGLDFARRLVDQGKKVFLDVKLLDIDNTVEHAVENIARLGMTFCTIHAYPKAMRAAVAGKGDAALRSSVGPKRSPAIRGDCAAAPACRRNVRASRRRRRCAPAAWRRASRPDPARRRIRRRRRAASDSRPATRASPRRRERRSRGQTPRRAGLPVRQARSTLQEGECAAAPS